MRIRLDCPVEDLAYRFGVSPSLATNIVTTFIIFLSLELEPLIYWSSPDDIVIHKSHNTIGRILPTTMMDLCDYIWSIACASFVIS